jgi:hypothetical protein
MPVSLYDVAIPTFQKQLASLEAFLDKSAEQAEAKKIDFAVLLGSRLFPDMFNLTRQVQLATDFAKAAPARLAGVEVPSLPDVETTLPELKARIAKVQALLAGYKPDQFEGSETSELTIKLGGQEMSMSGRDYLLHVAFPNFYFHCATAYDILRHNGMEIGKRDFVPRR